MAESPVHPPTLSELRAKREEILRVTAAHRVTNVRVFGSVARGDAGARDVDFVVDLPDDARGFHAFGILDELRQDLETVVGCRVDVIAIRGPFSPKGAAIAQRIEREALEL
jgi:predicted nucleotidyltransferase